MAIDGSELALTNCGKLPSDNDADGPGLSSKSDSGLDAYESREVVMGNRKSSERDSTGWGSGSLGAIYFWQELIFVIAVVFVVFLVWFQI